MLRLGLLLIGLGVVDLGFAQSSDPQAAAPVVYSDAAAASTECPSEDDTVACNSGDQYLEDDGADVWSDDDVAYDAPVYDDYVDFYPGVSLLPVDYWAPGFAWSWGWPCYAPYGFGWSYYTGLGWGWPYLAVSWSWGGHHHHHDGWGGHHHRAFAWQPYHGPYRYYGHGQYGDRHGSFGMRSARAFAAAANHVPTAGRTNASLVSTNNFARAGVGAHRATLASSSYYALAQRSGAASIRPGANMSRLSAAAIRGPGSRAVTNDSRYRVTSLPNRAYAHTSAYGPSGYRRANTTPYPHAVSGYAPRGGYTSRPYSAPIESATPRYSAPRNYSGSPIYSRGGGSYSSIHAGGGSAARSSGGGHASAASRSTH